MNEKTLTTKQKAFIKYYVENPDNLTDAAEKAGYSGNRKTLCQMAKQNLEIPKIQEEIRKQMAGKFSGKIITGDEAAANISSIAKGEEQKNGEKPSVSEILKASELICKMNQMFADRHQIEMKAEIKTELSTAEKKKRLSELLHKFQNDE